ncbi:SGNH/GDSL hydrolase family protein [Priestia sp. SB1]|uniref:SGNH/GDSL hydrolase family protein n=1 Tax=Priestia sp. SB1 TaxID=3132359 RepID=UPI00316EA6D1
MSDMIARGLAQKLISNYKTAKGKNLFNSTNKTIGYYVDGVTGSLKNDIASQNATEFIPVEPNKRYTASRTTYYAIYDSNKNRIAGSNTSSANSLTVTIPSNGAFIRLSVADAYLSTYQFELGDFSTLYQPFIGNYTTLSGMKVDYNDIVNLDYFKLTKAKNLFNSFNRTIGYYVDGLTGALKNDIASQNATEFIPVEANKKYTANRTTYYAIYDVNKAYITGANASTATPLTLTIPANGAFIRMSVRDDYISTYQIEEGDTSTAYSAFTPPYPVLNGVKVDYKDISNVSDVTNKWYGKTMNIIGDSITYGLNATTPYGALVASALGMKFNNYGISSSTIAVKSSDPTGRNPMVSRFSSMDDSADLVIVAGGTNDWMYDWTPLGDMSSRNNNEFYGALHNICLGLLSKYKGKQLLFMTPIKRAQAPYDQPNSVNANSKTLKQYGEIINEVCSYYGIPVLDMHNECTIFPFIQEQVDLLIPDKTHPNDAGQKIMANRLTGFLKQLA